MRAEKWAAVLGAALAVTCAARLEETPLAAQEAHATVPAPLPAACPDPAGVLQGPVLSEAHALPRLTPAPPEATDKPLPINLATALRLAGARPVIIAAAQASVQVAAAELERARVRSSRSSRRTCW
jgi:hypothetical protein